jgi:PAS domain-containing protein
MQADLPPSLVELQQENDRLQAELAQLRQENDRLRQSEARSRQTPLLSTVATVANLLLRSPDYNTVLPDVVRLLGEAVGSDRCVVAQCLVHLESGKPAVRVGSEWECCQEGVLHSDEFSPHTDRLFLWEDDTPYVYEKMRQGKVINALVTDIPEPDRNLFIAQGNTAELFVPIWVDRKLWGFIAFDNCGEPRLYDEAEIAILQVAAESLAAAIARQAKDEELRDSEKRYRTLFELSSEGIVRFGYEQPIPIALPIEEQVELCYRSIYIAEANDAYARMFEHKKVEDTIGLTLNDFHDRNSEITQATMRDWVENQYACRSVETVEFDRHGRKRYFLNSAASTIENVV